MKDGLGRYGYRSLRSIKTRRPLPKFAMELPGRGMFRTSWEWVQTARECRLSRSEAHFARSVRWAPEFRNCASVVAVAGRVPRQVCAVSGMVVQLAAGRRNSAHPPGGCDPMCSFLSGACASAESQAGAGDSTVGGVPAHVNCEPAGIGNPRSRSAAPRVRFPGLCASRMRIAPEPQATRSRSSRATPGAPPPPLSSASRIRTRSSPSRLHAAGRGLSARMRRRTAAASCCQSIRSSSREIFSA